MASRYNSYDSASSTAQPTLQKQIQPSLTSRGLVRSKQASTKINANNRNLANVLKKITEIKPSTSKASSNRAVGLVIPSNVIAEDLKKTARKGGNFVALQRKLFGDKVEKKSQVKALTEAKGGSNANARTLATVLRSERELLNDNKEQDIQISRLKMLLEQKNNEVEKLKDLCLRQREEIKALKSAILFPDAVDSHLQDVLEKQGSELKQAIPTLQSQVTSLTGQLQCLAEGLAEVKAEKFSEGTKIHRHGSCQRTPTYDHEDPANSLEFSSEDVITPGSPDNMFLKDPNPCLTPFSVKKKTEEFEAVLSDSLTDEGFCMNYVEMGSEFVLDSHNIKLSKRSDWCHNSIIGSTIARPTYRKPMPHEVF